MAPVKWRYVTVRQCTRVDHDSVHVIVRLSRYLIWDKATHIREACEDMVPPGRGSWNVGGHHYASELMRNAMVGYGYVQSVVAAVTTHRLQTSP